MKLFCHSYSSSLGITLRIRNLCFWRDLKQVEIISTSFLFFPRYFNVGVYFCLVLTIIFSNVCTIIFYELIFLSQRVFLIIQLTVFPAVLFVSDSYDVCVYLFKTFVLKIKISRLNYNYLNMYLFALFLKQGYWKFITCHLSKKFVNLSDSVIW